MNGTWVRTGSVRLALIDQCAPLITDAVICGHDRGFLAALAWPNVARASDSRPNSPTSMRPRWSMHPSSSPRSANASCAESGRRQPARRARDADGRAAFDRRQRNRRQGLREPGGDPRAPRTAHRSAVRRRTRSPCRPHRADARTGPNATLTFRTLQCKSPVPFSATITKCCATPRAASSNANALPRSGGMGQGRLRRSRDLAQGRPRRPAVPHPARPNTAVAAATSAMRRCSTRKCNRAGLSGLGFGVHSDIIAPYIARIGTEEQKQNWLPKVCSGEYILAIAHDRAGHRQRSEIYPHHRRARRRRVRHQRQQDLHQQRPECRPDHRGLQDRPERRREGREPDRGRGGRATVSAVAASSTRSASTRRTPPNSSSTTCACRSPTVSAKKARVSPT